ncbi:MAG: trypsin-like peptidase domain-containing protein [Candidatus Competibacteraceae bacterium]|nr:trypsin-like peptidase domain-containing protein [Candidatus Competibacteraceae bacterium]
MSTVEKHSPFEFPPLPWRSIAMFMLLALAMSEGRAASVGGGSPPMAGKASMSSPGKQLKQDYRVTAIPLQIVLDAVTTAEKSTLAAPRKNQPLKVGFAREVPQPYQEDLFPSLSWELLPDGGRVAAFSVTSPGARAIRVAIDVEGLPEETEMRFFGRKNSEIFGPFTARAIRAQQAGGNSSNTESAQDLFWSPVIEGETAGVEIYLPASVEGGFPIRAPKIQHLTYSLQYPNEENLFDIGSSAYCNIDVKCRDTVPDNLSAAVAKIIFTDPDGTWECTGTLLNDNDTSSWIPYFMTANHCLSTQSTANTIDSYWFFERAVCGGPNPTSVTHFTGGADLLATGASTDFTFLRLRDTQISSLPGIHFAGWTTTNPTGLTVVGIHHPQGDLKKWSQGTADGYTSWEVNGTDENHIQVTWLQGITEEGSSGSGIFAITGEQDGQQLFAGNLHGGTIPSCSRINLALYGRFDLTYPSVSQWLDSSGSGAYLESPQQDSFESGIGLIRGWTCQANKVEIQIDGGARQQVAYGTTRPDTAATCGDDDNGFGYTFNWNTLGSGGHNLRAFADDVEFANVNFTVTTLGVEYLEGVSGEATLPDFPQAGDNVTVRWAEPHQNFVIVGTSRRLNIQPAAAVPLAQFPANLESPQQGSFESGIGLIRGWICQASTVEIQIDGGASQRVAYGTTRPDTVAACGDSDNGFGYTFNWNRLGNGTHNLRAFADGVEFANVNFTVTTLGVEYLEGASGQYLLPNFPRSGNDVTVRWAEPHQNFVIVSFTGS